MDLNQNKRKKVTVFHFMHKFMAKLIHKPLTDRIPPNQPISVEILNFQRRVETTHCRSFQLKMVFASSDENRLILETVNCTNTELGHSGAWLVGPLPFVSQKINSIGPLILWYVVARSIRTTPCHKTYILGFVHGYFFQCLLFQPWKCCNLQFAIPAAPFICLNFKNFVPDTVRL